MSLPILIISDTHYHNFNQYSQLDKFGKNTRLMEIISATYSAAQHLKKLGGRTIIHCGDVFHVRGQITPSVLNPVMSLYKTLVREGFDIKMISGNHDLESKDAEALKSSVTALTSAGVMVANTLTIHGIGDETWVFQPWINSLSDLKACLPFKKAEATKHQKHNLVIHAPLNGVLTGMPDIGLRPEDFKDLGYDNVFVGHYHNHKKLVVPGTSINLYSVGALTHQTWGDVDSLAGYLIYYPNSNTVAHYETNAPKFVKVKLSEIPDTDESLLVDNYVKVVDGEFEKMEEIEAIKEELIIKGAKAVVVEGFNKRPAVTRSVATTKSDEPPTIHKVLGDYVDRNYPGQDAVKALALEILGEVYD